MLLCSMLVISKYSNADIVSSLWDTATERMLLKCVRVMSKVTTCQKFAVMARTNIMLSTPYL